MGSASSSTSRAALTRSLLSSDTSNFMRAVIYNEFGGIDKLALATLPRPSLHPGQVLVRVSASSINPIDFKRREGKMKMLVTEQFPIIPAYDLSGSIVAVGPNAEGKFNVGDEVFSRVGSRDASGGTLAEYVAVNVDHVALKPRSVSHEEAASIPLAGLTALQSMRDAGVREGSRVLITGGAGGVGTLAIQIAKHILGASMVATTASGPKADLCRSLGADTVVDYRVAPFETQLPHQSFDVGFDTTGEVVRMCPLIRPGGHIASVAEPPSSSALKAAGLPVGCFMSCIIDCFISGKAEKAAAAAGLDYKFQWMTPSGKDLELLAKAIDDKKIKPVIDTIFPFDQFAQAFEKLEGGRATGKVVIRV
eukprot:gnl/Spiro4/194_TR108_c0_g1_i1.p1 gnl/Spiro4/194_TR108_c0_g1~~gnl/Spiro4/194_TR108_c0_g1_i1.p1  ORF type:complete len:365 (-),score=78.72 gnl/Spiro4/194_TR108_c0_g1_i1:74-1168(-)